MSESLRDDQDPERNQNKTQDNNDCHRTFESSRFVRTQLETPLPPYLPLPAGGSLTNHGVGLGKPTHLHREQEKRIEQRFVQRLFLFTNE